MNSKQIYYVIMTTFLLRVAFTALPYESKSISWYILNTGQTATFQFAFWRLLTLLIETILILVIMSTAFNTSPIERVKILKMTRIMFYIQLWYIIEYCTHYTSVWVTWEQLGFNGNGRSGLSSHIITMSVFGIKAWYD